MERTIIGCGDIGRRVAQLERRAGRTVEAVVRSADRAAQLAGDGLPVRVADLDRPDSLRDLPLAGRAVLYLAPPPASGQSDPRMENFCAAAARSPPARVVYVSTTGVYGDCRGELVDETRPPAPASDRARCRLAAETTLRRQAARWGTATVILRVAGIYGPGRLPLAALRAGRPVLDPALAPWSNRIHADDLARICQAALTRAADGAIFNVCDGEQSTLSDYFLATADAFGLPRPPLVDWAEARRRLSPGFLSFLAESRRIDNRHLRRELGIDLRYPDLAAGLAACRAAAVP